MRTAGEGLPIVQVFDLRSEPIVLSTREWNRSAKRDPKDQRGIALHQWATPVGTTVANRRRYGEPEALARRALGVPAQVSVGVTQHSQTPIVAVAHPLDRYLYGSDAGNGSFLTLEVMGSFPFEERTRSMHHTQLTPALEAAITVGLQVALDLLEEWTMSQGPWELITHRQCCNSKGDHQTCPGEGVLSLALKSMSGSGPLAGRLLPNPDEVLDSKWGKTWPESWRSHLHHEVQITDQDLFLES